MNFYSLPNSTLIVLANVNNTFATPIGEEKDYTGAFLGLAGFTLLCCLVGVVMGIYCKTKLSVAPSLLTIFLIPHILMFVNGDSYIKDQPNTWIITFTTGIFHLGFFQIVMHIIPAYISYKITKKVITKNKTS
jgi:CDP-diglyceride synthetase